MESNEVEHYLQEITHKHLQITRHASNEANYQKRQFLQVADALTTQLKNIPQLLDILDSDISVVPAMSDISRTEMENIGTSSVLCLEFLNQTAQDDLVISEDLRILVIKFFKKAIEQARSACVRYDQEAAAHPQEQTTYEARLLKFLEDSVADIEKRRLLVEQDLEVAETAAAAAKAAAELAQNIADSAKLEASKAAQAASTASDAATTARDNANSAESTISSVKGIADEAKANADNALNSATNAENKAELLIPNMLTVLGIFVAIIIAVVACYLSILLAKNGIKVSNGVYSRPFEFMQFMLMGHIMLGVIFLLLYLVSKLTSHSLTCYCKNFVRNGTSSNSENFDCSECQKKCSSPAHLRSRYPYIFGINLVFTIAYAALGLWQVINVYYRSILDAAILSHPVISAIVFFVIALIPVLAVCFVFRRRK